MDDETQKLETDLSHFFGTAGVAETMTMQVWFLMDFGNAIASGAAYRPENHKAMLGIQSMIDDIAAREGTDREKESSGCGTQLSKTGFMICIMWPDGEQRGLLVLAFCVTCAPTKGHIPKLIETFLVPILGPEVRAGPEADIHPAGRA